MSIEPHQHEARDILTNIGIHTALDSALNQLFTKEPIIRLYNSINYAEIGQTVNNLTLTWEVIQGQIFSLFLEGIGTISPEIRGYTLQNQNIKSNKVYTLRYSDVYVEKAVSTSIVFTNKVYWGLSKSEKISNEEVLLLNSDFDFEKNKKKTFRPDNEYIYFAYPLRYGESIFKFNGIFNSAWEVEEALLTNSYGNSEYYYIYRSTFLQNGMDIVVELETK